MNNNWHQYRAQYRKTLWPVQAFILVSSAMLFYMSRAPGSVALYFVTMQMASACGAAWGVRLKNKVARATGLPIP